LFLALSGRRWVITPAAKLKIAEFLIDKGADVFATDSNKRSLLVPAAQNGHLALMERLMGMGLSIAGSKEILMEAAEGGSVEVVKFLMEKGADPNEKGTHGGTPLHEAARKGHIEVVKLLLDAGASASAKEEYTGAVPLMRAVDAENLECVKVILENAKDTIDIRDSYHKRSALLMAIKDNKIEIAHYLIRSGASLSVSDKKGQTALHYAAKLGLKETVDLLLEKGANINMKDKKNALPYMVAFGKGHEELADLLKPKK